MSTASNDSGNRSNGEHRRLGYYASELSDLDRKRATEAKLRALARIEAVELFRNLHH